VKRALQGAKPGRFEAKVPAPRMQTGARKIKLRGNVSLIIVSSDSIANLSVLFKQIFGVWLEAEIPVYF
jgi:DNA polymerase III psi subunit